MQNLWRTFYIFWGFMEEYKSSDKRLAGLFKKSRDRWQGRVAEKQKKLRYQAVKIRDLEHSRDLWKERAQTAETALKEALRQMISGSSQSDLSKKT